MTVSEEPKMEKLEWEVAMTFHCGYALSFIKHHATEPFKVQFTHNGAGEVAIMQLFPLVVETDVEAWSHWCKVSDVMENWIK